MPRATKRPTLEQRVEEFRSLVYKAIRRADEVGQSVRPYDGTVSLQWPATVYTRSENRKYTLRLSCSVLGGASSHFCWSGRSWRTVFDHATHDVEQWIADLDKEPRQ